MPIHPLTGDCVRCHEPATAEGAEPDPTADCASCGVNLLRPVRVIRRRNIGGKRGRNSGKVSQHGKKS